MIQLNLLPDVKIDYIKSRRNKRMVMAISLAVIAGSVVLFISMFSFVQAQKKHLADLNTDIGKYRSQLETTEDIGKILTVQNQLNNVDGLHDEKPSATRIVPYLTQVTPAEVTFSNISVDFTTTTFNLSGNAKDLATVNKFIDTLKFTDYKSKDNLTGKAFTGVVLSGFSKEDEKSTFQITFKYDPVILDNAAEVQLTVPSIISTRSSVEKPLFQDNKEGTQ